MSLSFKISTPVYKQEEFIETTLESIKIQKAPFQLAVLDASPDDGSQKIIQKYKSIITYSYHHADEGQSAAIEEGWAHTEGDIAVWLNSDDYYFPYTLEKVTRIFEDNPQVDVVYGHCVCTRGDGSFFNYSPAVSPNPADLSWTDNIAQPSCFVRTKALKKVGPVRKDLHYTMDWELWLRLRDAGSKFYFLDEILSVACMHENTKTLSGREERFREISTLLLNHASGKQYISAILKKIAYQTFTFIGLRSIIGKTLRKARKFKYFLRPPQAYIRGLQSWTNKVNNECFVTLPWYKKTSPESVTIITSTPHGLSFTFEGKTIELNRSNKTTVVFFTETVTGYEYETVLPNTTSNILNFSLRSKNTWQLFSLRPNEKKL